MLSKLIVAAAVAATVTGAAELGVNSRAACIASTSST
jgi:hypothetical protein